MTFLYITWVIYCVAPMTLVIYLFTQRYLGNQEMTIDIEYVGGPDDGHRTILVGLEDEVLLSYSPTMDIIYKYLKTNRRTSEGFLIYEFTGYKNRKTSAMGNPSTDPGKK